MLKVDKKLVLPPIFFVIFKKFYTIRYNFVKGGLILKNLILCGGSGTRLWPLSRKLMPKQFLKLFSNKSLFQLTIKRNSNLCEGFIVSVNEDQYFLALDQIEELTTHYPLFT